MPPVAGAVAAFQQATRPVPAASRPDRPLGGGASRRCRPPPRRCRPPGRRRWPRPPRRSRRCAASGTGAGGRRGGGRGGSARGCRPLEGGPSHRCRPRGRRRRRRPPRPPGRRRREASAGGGGGGGDAPPGRPLEGGPSHRRGLLRPPRRPRLHLALPHEDAAAGPGFEVPYPCHGSVVLSPPGRRAGEPDPDPVGAACELDLAEVGHLPLERPDLPPDPDGGPYRQGGHGGKGGERERGRGRSRYPKEL